MQDGPGLVVCESLEVVIGRFRVLVRMLRQKITHVLAISDHPQRTYYTSLERRCPPRHDC
jgi:hypothetical protein